MNNHNRPEFSLVPQSSGKPYGRLYIPSPFQDIPFRSSRILHHKGKRYSNGDRVVYFTATNAEYRRLYRLYPNPLYSETTETLL